MIIIKYFIQFLAICFLITIYKLLGLKYSSILSGKIFTFFVLIIGVGVVTIPAGLIGSALSEARDLEKKNE